MECRKEGQAGALLRKVSVGFLSTENAGWAQSDRYLTLKSLDRRKREIWTPMAEEFGVTWQSVDAMHWALGKEELARRAQEANCDSKQSGKSESLAEASTPGTRQFEEYRIHHFNATRPPQVQLQMSVTSQPVNDVAGQATLPRISDPELASSSMENNGEANLTVEGKRQVRPNVSLFR